MPGQAPIGDRYELKEPLGEGGMGIVYRAYDLKTRSYVALKTMKDGSDPVAVELFSKEWTVLASLCHPNIVDIRDVGEIEERGQRKPFFVMPLLPGVPLSDLINTSSARLTPDRLIYIVFQVCRGLHAAHERGLVHRDIKPTNIFVMEDDTAKIIDFGVVYLAGSQSVTGLKGTWQYMAPEQVDLKPASPISDIFSLGVVCYEALTGRKPFARKTPGETAEAIRHYIPPPACEINPNVSRLVSMAIHTAMAKQPIHRYPSARDFGDTLQKAYHNEPIERFDRVKIQPRIERAKKAFEGGDPDFASEILTELEGEGHIDPEIALVRARIDNARRQKKIRQLLEAARTRLEQDEIPLALEKLHEVLEIDPENTDALAMISSIEKQSNERQIESWMSLAQRHFERQDFVEARQAVSEVLKIRATDTAALSLLTQIEHREKDTIRVRSEQEQLYTAAMKDYQKGEISTALGKLERLLELGRHTPFATLADREAVYQGLYNQVRSDRDSIHNAYEEARRQLADKNFPRALQICDEFIDKYPNDAIFKALKLEAVEQQRQELSGFIVDVGRRLDAEPDLERKVNILKEACERYKDEQQFQQSLKLMRERRDLVLSIVAKARYYEERGLFTDALGQWDILRNIYPSYPAIDVEVAQLKNRRDEQARDEAKVRAVEQIERALEAGDYARACDLCQNALADHPDDQELMGLQRLARQGLERSAEAGKLCSEAQALIGQGKLQEAESSLRLALELDAKNPAAREALVSVLATQARPKAEAGDWRAAEPLVQQAFDLDPAHPEVRMLRTLVAEAKRKELVSQCLAEVRELQLTGDLQSALTRNEVGLAQYPNEPRLIQQQTSLQNAIRDAQREQERGGDVETLRTISQNLDHSASPAARAADLQRVEELASKHTDDPEIGSLVADIRNRAPAPPEGSIFLPGNDSVFAKPVPVPQGPDGPGQGVAVQRAPAADPGLPVKTPTAPVATRPPLRIGRWKFQLAIAGGLVVLIFAGVAAWRLIPKRKTPTPPPPDIAVQIQTTPPDATVTVNGEPRSGTIRLPSNGTYAVLVSRLGFQSHQEIMQPQARWNFVLQPSPIHLVLSTSEKTGKIFVDENEKADLQGGGLQDLELSADGADHVIALRNGNKQLLSLTFNDKPGEVPRVSNLKPKDLIVVSSLGNDAFVYSGSATLRANLTGQELQPIPAEGLKLTGISATANQVAFSDSNLPKVPIDTGNAPALYVGLNADMNIGYLLVQSTTPNAQLLLEGVEIKPTKPGVWGPITRKPGKYMVAMRAAGYQEYQEQLELEQGKTKQFARNLTLLATTATLIIDGGTPGAQVIIDGAPGRSLDSSGSLRTEVSAGPHTITFHKDLFEPSAEVRQNFALGQEVKLGAAEAKLKEYGTLQFNITPADAQVTYRRGDQGEAQHAKGRDSVHVPQGKYSVIAEASGYNKETHDYTVTPGQSSLVDVKLTPDKIKPPPPPPPPSPARTIEALFEKPEQVMQFGEWWLSMAKVDYVFLKPDIIRDFDLTFHDPGKSRFGNQKKVEWVIAYVSDKERVRYEFDGKKLDRTVFASGKEQKASVVCQAEGKDFQFQISIRPNAITVRSQQCGIAQSYEAVERDLTMGKIGIKPRITEFIIR